MEPVVVQRKGFGRMRLPLVALAGFIGVGMLVAGTLSGCSALGDTSSSAAPVALSRSAVQASGPSEAAKMTCSIQTQASVASALDLRDLPEPHADWSNPTYRCDYDLDAGTLVLTVEEFPDAASSLRRLQDLESASPEAEPLVGLASLGLPGFKVAGGTVVFAKDNMTLVVDATAMQSHLGPNRVSQADFAYQIATNILACWQAHH